MAIALAGLSVVIAATGTAVAVTATTVNIADPTSPSRVAHVDSSGRLTTAGVTSTLGETLYPNANEVTTFVTATTATLAVTRLTLSNPVENGGSQPISFSLSLVRTTVGSHGTCADSDRQVSYISSVGSVPPGTADIDLIGAIPVSLKPVSGKAYCLAVDVETFEDVTEFSYFYPVVSWAAYVAAGSYSGPGTYSRPGQRGAVPRAARHVVR